MIGYPKWFTKNIINSIFVTSAVTGTLLFPTILVLKLDWNFPWRLPNEYRDGIVILHVLFGFIVFTLLGALASVHMRLGFRKKKKIISGVSLIGLISLLGISGLGILYFGDEQFSTYSSLTHLILGFLLIMFYLGHLFTRVPKK